MVKIPSIQMHRFEWIIRNAKGYILDVGCNDTSAWACNGWYPSYPDIFQIKDMIFFDCDIWIPTWLPNPKFVRGDATHLPFKDNICHTVVFGDILEHVKSPEKILQEAKRVTRDRIIITIPCESEWKVPETQIHTVELDSYCSQNDTIEEQEIKSTIQHPSVMAKCTEALKEKNFKHLWHLQLFNDDKIIKLIESLEMDYNIFKLHYGPVNDEYVTYGIILWK